MTNITRTITLFTLSPDKTIDRFARSFTETMKEMGNNELKVQVVYQGEGNQLFNSFKDSPPDLLITLNPECTRLAQNAIDRIAQEQSDITIPHIASNLFSERDKPTESMPSQSKRVAASHDYADKLKLILGFTQSLDHITILYDSSSQHMITLSDEVYALLRERDVVTTRIPLSQAITRKTTSQIAMSDMLMLFSDRTHPTYIQRFALICRQHKTLLYVSDNNALPHGAAISFGKDSRQFGRKAALLAHYFFDKKSFPETESTSDYVLKVNIDEVQRNELAHLKIAPLLALIGSTKMVEPSTQEKVAAYLRLENITLE